MRRFRWFFTAAVAVVFLPLALDAQERGTITGTVVDQATGQPLAGAQVHIPGTVLGSLTNRQGEYSIGNVPAGDQNVRALLIGYRAGTQSVQVAPGATVTANFQLRQSAVALDEVVVTGTAGRQDRRAQSAVVTRLDAANIVETAPITSVTDLLQARTPGVSITQAGGTSGTGQRIRLRGAASIGLSNEPIVIIDGVRMDSRTGGVGGYGVGGQARSRLNDINPEDIESIEIVKGPAAATLYGADATAGVIQILTKRGQHGIDFSQTATLEYNSIRPSWTPDANWGTCSAAHVQDARRHLCFGQEVGTIVSDNPAVRYDMFQQGHTRSANWTGRGGGENFGYFLSLGLDDEQGILPNNQYERMNSRLNFDWTPHPTLRIDAGTQLARIRADLPNNDNNIYGFLGGVMLGSPLTVGDFANDGWYAGNRQVAALSAMENVNTAIRTTPTLTFHYNPVDWFSNRLTAGVDMTRSESRSFFPRNDHGWYGTAALNSGSMGQARQNRDEITIDYLGNVSTDLTAALRSDLALGFQILSLRSDLTSASGVGFTTNAARAINAAAETSGGQSFSERREFGALGQWDLAWQERLYLQLGGRLDQHSAFGEDAEPFFSPKVGVSYVISEEPFWAGTLGNLLPTFRLRTAYGTTGRSPGSGAALTTFSSQPFAITSAQVGSGVVPANPGNPALRPERGTEFEIGFDAGMFDERLGLELTYFDKVSSDLILSRPIPGSLGFTQNPSANVGKVVNRGLEVGADARLVDLPNFRWSARLGFNTLHNEVLDLGDLEPIGSTLRVIEGHPVYGRWTHVIREFDVANNVAIVSDTVEYFGNSTPELEGNLSTTLTFFRNLRLYAQLDHMGGFVLYNNTDQFRERQMGTGERWVRRNEILTDEERLERFGPFVTESGDALHHSAVDVAYIEDGTFTRLRELALSYSLPGTLVDRIGVRGASLTLAGRNIALWTDYGGPDPEVLTSNTSHSRGEFLTVPPTHRWVARVNLQF